MATILGPLPQPNFPWIDRATGQPTQAFAQYMVSLDAVVKALSGKLTNATNDTTAAAAGIAVGSFYRNGSVVQIRVT